MRSFKEVRDELEKDYELTEDELIAAGIGPILIVENRFLADGHDYMGACLDQANTLIRFLDGSCYPVERIGTFNLIRNSWEWDSSQQMISRIRQNFREFECMKDDRPRTAIKYNKGHILSAFSCALAPRPVLFHILQNNEVEPELYDAVFIKNPPEDIWQQQLTGEELADMITDMQYEGNVKTDYRIITKSCLEAFDVPYLEEREHIDAQFSLMGQKRDLRIYYDNNNSYRAHGYVRPVVTQLN